MTDWTIYNPVSGRIDYTLTAPLGDVALTVPTGFAALVGKYDPGTFYVVDGAAAPFPPRPSPNHIWNYTASQWIDPRTPADLAAELTTRRNAASLDKSTLLIALVSAGILTAPEAEQAATGTIPARMVALMTTLPAEAQMAARIKWASDTTISRTHPVIVTAAYALGVSDETLDRIFGVTV